MTAVCGSAEAEAEAEAAAAAAVFLARLRVGLDRSEAASFSRGYNMISYKSNA